MRYTERSNSGFTMVELLIVAVVMAIIGMTMYSALSNGVRIWSRVNERLGVEDVGILFEKFESDVRNCARVSATRFSGGEDGVSFAGLVPSAVLGSSTVGTIGYSYDSEHDALLRSQKDIFDVYADNPGAVRSLLNGVKSAKFSYYVYLKEAKRYMWLDDIRSGVIPLAIRMEANVQCEGRTERFTKTVSIPVAD
jgi:prepilin-type N-terminal cleavage/methylation domain-containing protein